MLQTKEPKTQVFPAGTTRFVCVNRQAIVANLKHNHSFPTTIVVENGKCHEFHEVKVSGSLKFDPARQDLPAKVFIETADEVIGVTDPAQEPTYLNYKPVPILKRLGRKIKERLLYVPVVSCLVNLIEE